MKIINHTAGFKQTLERFFKGINRVKERYTTFRHMIKLSGSYTGSAYYELNDPFNTGLSELNAQVRSVHISYYNSKFIREGIPDSTLSVRKEQLFLYDQTGHIIEERTASKDGVQMVRKFFIYNEQNKLVEIDIFGNDQDLHEKWIFHYDNRGNNIAQEHYFSQSSLIEKWKFIYDESGKLTEEHKFGNNIFMEKWTYRMTGQFSSEQCRFLSDGLPDEKWQSIYNSKGKRVSASRYLQDGRLFEKYDFNYDNNGNLVEEFIENIAESYRLSKRYDYVYDSRGNWTCLIEFRDHEPHIMIKRSIRYLHEPDMRYSMIPSVNFKRHTILTPVTRQ